MHVKHGRAHRSFCVLAWIVAGLYLFLHGGRPEALLTWKALIFFGGGIVVAPLVLGSFGAWVHKVLVQALLIALRPAGDAAMGLIRLAGLAVLLAEGWVVYELALWAFAQNWGAA
jgi:hypothetical protein